MENNSKIEEEIYGKKAFPVISEESKANEILNEILQNKNAVIGIDTEAALEMSRFGILCLLQISYNDNVYIFDMLNMNMQNLKLKEVFTKDTIIKVFHDCIEDISLLISSGCSQNLKGIFDTQIAYRMFYTDESNINDNNSKNIAISLGELLNQFFGIDSDLKNEIHNLLSKNPYLWKTRPISPKLNYYAGCDVIYLPKIYNIFYKKCKEDKNINIENIFTECQKYLRYVNINKNIKNYNKMNLTVGTKLQGLIKNFQNFCVFVQLNIGYMGVVYKFASVKLIKQKYKIGDIICFSILHVEHSKKKYVLDISEENNNTNNNSEEESDDKHIIMDENENKIINGNLKLCDNLNISEKSFYPKSYLANQNKENNNIITQNNINANINSNNNNINLNLRLIHNFSNGWLNVKQYPIHQNIKFFNY